jgi:uncharacterized membrane protein YhiD involved in acid resistance
MDVDAWIMGVVASIFVALVLRITSQIERLIQGQSKQDERMAVISIKVDVINETIKTHEQDNNKRHAETRAQLELNSERTRRLEDAFLIQSRREERESA